MAKDIFERLAQGRPPVEEPVKQPRGNYSQIERFLDWLVNRWTKPHCHRTGYLYLRTPPA